eukprot:c16783_g1_i1 orf=88-1050(+)
MQEQQEEDKDLEVLFSTVFGDSDSEGNEDKGYGVSKRCHSEVQTEGWGNGDQKQIWERVEEVTGLWLCRNLLTNLQQQHLLATIDAEGWFADGAHNQAMRFGDLPSWASELSCLIRGAICSYPNFPDSTCELGPSMQILNSDLPLPHRILWREPLFDQMIINCYQPGEGICPHVDLLRFEDGIAIISLESSCVMHFTRVRRPYLGLEIQSEEAEESYASKEPQSSMRSAEMEKENGRYWKSGHTSYKSTNGLPADDMPASEKVPVLLMPGDLILMSGEARYDWLHEINRKEADQVWNGQKINQTRRVSVTLRRLCKQKEI